MIQRKNKEYKNLTLFCDDKAAKLNDKVAISCTNLLTLMLSNSIHRPSSRQKVDFIKNQFVVQIFGYNIKICVINTC